MCILRGMCAVFSLTKRIKMRNSVGAGAVKGWVGTLASPKVKADHSKNPTEGG